MIIMSSWSPELGIKVYGLAASALIGALLFLILLIRLFTYFTLGVCRSQKKMNGKVVVVTGANSGIGKETAMDMARRGARVIMACRNLESGNKVRSQIILETKNPNVILMKLDLSNLNSVREFAAEVNQSEKRLDVLIHNAGMANTFTKQTTMDGLEITMATNQYGPFLLTHLLIDLLKKTAPSRIVIVASELYRFAKLNLDNPNPVNSLPAYLYYVSKYANIMFTLELARRLKGTGVTANCIHPGMIDSGIWRNVPFPLNLPLKLIVKGFFKSPKEGAQTTIYCAVSEEVEGVSGKYFLDCKENGLSEGVQDMAKNKKYWEICEKLVHLQASDPKI
ncbi:retinol dehydrogenase 14 isoform X2 [Nilaparvata lugens]|uniref:retinol dehydrogenase 14 isoform X2 n=2 Tax=Nilaparvata lugens TaxID=108931 RepID=UPI00193DC542|nr:retinol dehydrogenase 14 isoform X2 [Nilaparvata lugens]